MRVCAARLSYWARLYFAPSESASGAAVRPGCRVRLLLGCGLLLSGGWRRRAAREERERVPRRKSDMHGCALSVG